MADSKLCAKEILLAQLFSNGDCLYATAVARQIKADYPGCRLTWAIAPFCKSIIENNPFVDEILVTDEVRKNDAAAFRRYKKKLKAEQAAGVWDEVFVTTNMDTNLGYYDGTIRGMILRAYGKPITVPLQPVLVLGDEEIQRVEEFAAEHRLANYDNIILWEFAPQSGQADLNFSTVFEIAKQIIQIPRTAIILTSANKFSGTAEIIDGSVLSIRENAALTHHSTLLIGCSSGITWLNTSTAGKFLPMVQLLNGEAPFINRPSEDFRRYELDHNGLIEMDRPDKRRIVSCVHAILAGGFDSAVVFNDQFDLKFSTSKKIFYNLLVYREFRAILKHVQTMESVFGRLPKLRKLLGKTITQFPFQLASNIWRKRLKTHF